LHLASLGVSVVCAGRTESKLQSTYEQIIHAGGVASISVGDAATMEGNKKYVDDAIAKFGQLHIAINNAGVVSRSKLVDITPEVVNEVLGTNVNSVIYGLKYQLPVIGKYSTADDKGVVVNMMYDSSKAAADMISRALEAGLHNIRVVAVNPAFMDSSMTTGFYSEEKFHDSISVSSNAAADPQDIADMVAYLLAAPRVNGNTQ
jgi:NAD(P)-dependent dehydrogenase (short-subunit alcohol dehydrogenase family)